MEQGIITNIQKYCVHDGEGIRTTVFMKGCALRCRWCHNPESQSFSPQLLLYQERCIACGSCISACPAKAISPQENRIATNSLRCNACGRCVMACAAGAREIAGKAISVGELVCLLERDLPFYESSSGGVTLSGGEVMEQPYAFVLALVKKLHEKGIGVNIDTCGYAPWERFEGILPYVDTFLYDVKAITPALHQELTGVDNALILENLKRLSDSGARIHIRIPVVEGANAADDEINAMIAWLWANIAAEAVSLLPYHRTGIEKHQRMGESIPEYPDDTPTEQRLEILQKRFQAAGFQNCKIGG